MGLFDNKKKKADDFDSPVERVDLTAAATDDASTAAADDDDSELVAAAEPAAAGPSKARPAASRSPVDYGIDEAIALMRTLPADNVELVVRVVKHTLESTRIEIRGIIDDASAKQERLRSRVELLESEIADHEREIATRRDEIARREADLQETTLVKERLELAEKLGTSENPAPLASPGAISRPPGSGPIGASPLRGGERPRARSTSAPPPSPGSSASTHSIVPKK